MKTNRRSRKLFKEEDTDPLSVIVNLFDVALMVAMGMHMDTSELFIQENYTIVKNPGKDNMEIITKEGNTINRYTPLRRTIRRPQSRHRLRIGKRRNHL